MKSFAQLFETFDCRPIPNCPGRYVLRAAGKLSPADILDQDSRASEYRVATARDVVVVARLDDGGLISYRRADDSFLHTVNTTEGFERKLKQLGIEFPDD